MNRRERTWITHMIHKSRTALERSAENILLEGFNRFYGANLTRYLLVLQISFSGFKH